MSNEYDDLFEQKPYELEEALNDGLNNSFHQEYNKDYIEWCKLMLCDMHEE